MATKTPKAIPNKTRRNWYSVMSKAETETAEVFIFDEIGFFGVTAKDFIRDFGALKNKNITLHLNSPGGNVFDGITIFNAIRNHSAFVTAQIDGIAASIASIIALGADKVEIASNGFMMIHRAQGVTIGGADDMRKQADVLEKIDGTLAKTYADKTGESSKVMLALMDDETWFTADEAVDLGLADSISAPGEAEAVFDLSGFKNAPLDLQGKPEKQIEAEEKRDTEKTLRDVGFSQKEAKVLASNGIDGFKEMQRRDAVGSDSSSATELVNKFVIETLISKFNRS